MTTPTPPTPFRPDAASAPAQAVFLPCPFCGGAETHDPIDGLAFKIVCSTCGAGTDTYDTIRNVIDAWNRRAAPPHRRRDEGAVTEAMIDAAQEAYYENTDVGTDYPDSDGMRAALEAAERVRPGADE